MRYSLTLFDSAGTVVAQRKFWTMRGAQQAVPLMIATLYALQAAELHVGRRGECFVFTRQALDGVRNAPWN